MTGAAMGAGRRVPGVESVEPQQGGTVSWSLEMARDLEICGPV